MATAISDIPMVRTRPPKKLVIRQILEDPDIATAELCRQDFYFFMQEFWDCVSNDPPHWNWHISYMCDQLMKIARQVSKRLPKLYDLIFNVPPGETKSITCSVMFPVWCWINWPWMRFICASYTADLALEQAELSRELVRHEKFQRIFPYLQIKPDKDTKGNFKLIYFETDEEFPEGRWKVGGNRFSTGVGGTLTGFHGHIKIVDDPINPKKAASIQELKTTNDWMDLTLSNRSTDKDATPTILIMQRLHDNDPTGHRLEQDKGKNQVFHVCMPGEINNYRQFVRPIELIDKYSKDGLLDPKRLSQKALDEAMTILGQLGYAGQIGQNPAPPSGAMFNVSRFIIIDQLPMSINIVKTVRYWDKAGTEGGVGARTSGTKMSLLKNGKYIVHDCKVGRWSTDEREDIVHDVAQADGPNVRIGIEQEPGSGGLDSVRSSIKNLAGFNVTKDRPTGDKIYRADPWSVQVNHGNVMLLRGDWNHSFIEEHRPFPFGTLKDQVDSASGAFKMLTGSYVVENLLARKRELPHRRN